MLRLKRDRSGLRIFSENRLDDLLVLFRLQRACRVDDAAAGTNGSQRCGKNCALAFGLAWQVLEFQSMANLRIAAERAGPATWHIGQCKIEDADFSQRGCIGQTAFDAVAVSGETLAQLGQPLRTRFAGDDAGLGVALGEDQGFAAGSGAAVENISPVPAVQSAEFPPPTASLHPEVARGPLETLPSRLCLLR